MNKKRSKKSGDNVERISDWTEHARLYYDCCKHFATLSAGSIGLMLTMLEKLSKAPDWKVLVPVSVSCFLLSLISSLFAMVCFASYSKERDDTPRDPSGLAGKTFVAAMLLLWFGVTSLAGFMWKNV